MNTLIVCILDIQDVLFILQKTGGGGVSAILLKYYHKKVILRQVKKFSEKVLSNVDPTGFC